MIFVTHQCGMSQTTDALRIPCAIFGASSVHALSIMYPVGVIAIVEPLEAPLRTKNSSVKPVLRRTPGGRKAVGPFSPAADPVRYKVMLVRELAVPISCLALSLFSDYLDGAI